MEKVSRKAEELAAAKSADIDSIRSLQQFKVLRTKPVKLGREREEERRLPAEQGFRRPGGVDVPRSFGGNRNERKRREREEGDTGTEVGMGSRRAKKQKRQKPKDGE